MVTLLTVAPFSPEMPKVFHNFLFVVAPSHTVARTSAPVDSSLMTHSINNFASTSPLAAPLVAKIANGCTYSSGVKEFIYHVNFVKAYKLTSNKIQLRTQLELYGRKMNTRAWSANSGPFVNSSVYSP